LRDCCAVDRKKVGGGTFLRVIMQGGIAAGFCSAAKSAEWACGVCELFMVSGGRFWKRLAVADSGEKVAPEGERSG